MRMLGERGMVASPHYLATGAGLRVLRNGGSAVDAAIATNAVLAVVVPYMCGLGGDLFAQVYSPAERSLVGLNGSGRAPAEATAERVRALIGGRDTIPDRGPLPITVPGCVEAWGALHGRFGRLPLSHVLADAIRYAEEGFPVTAQFARAIGASASFLHPQTPARETFLPDGVAPREGQILKQPRLARSLRTIATEGPDAYYRGWIGEEIVRAVRSVGGLLDRDDLVSHCSNWVEPLQAQYRDITVFELPPNSQGIVALLILRILEGLPEARVRSGEAEYVHVLAEAARLAYADRELHLTDPEHMVVDPESLLSAEHVDSRSRLIGSSVGTAAPVGTQGDTIYLCAADSDGCLVSLIESNFMGIGSGVMGGETGIMLQNRGQWFSLDPTHVNVIAPRKRTAHTLMPGMAFKEGRPWLVFGSMGGSAQAQIHAEILTRLVDRGMKLDEAIDAPRFDAVVGAGELGRPLLAVEEGFPQSEITELERRGHEVERLSSVIGHAHGIEIANGVYIGAADPRAESLALGY